MTRIFFGVDIPYQLQMIDWEETYKNRVRLGPEWRFGKDTVWVPFIRIKKEMFFELCDICGTQIVGGRQKRHLTTCCPEHNQIKWNNQNGKVLERERNLVGVRPTYFWNTISRECFNRDNYTCQNCHKNLAQLQKDMVSEYGKKVWSPVHYNLECHHIIPISMGGSNKLDNLVTLCGKCHRAEHTRIKNKARKHHTIPEDF